VDVTSGQLQGRGTLAKVEGPTLKADTLGLFDTTKILFESATNFFLAGLLPLAGGIFLFWVVYQVIVQGGVGTSLPILITFGLGIPLVLAARLLGSADFFDRKMVAYSGK